MIFELHAHSTLKPFLSHLKPKKKISCWTNIRVYLIIDELKTTGNRLDSQSCLTQMWEGKVNLAVLSLHAIERELTETIILRFLSIVSMKLSYRLLRNIRKCKPGYGYTDLIKGELLHLRKAARERPGKLVFLKKGDSLDPQNLQGKINIIFSVEGGHAFLDTEKVEDFNFEDDAQITNLLNRFDNFINANTDITIVCLTLVHMARGPLCTHAFAYPAFRENFSNINFLPHSFMGINKAGWRVIQKCIDNHILIDVKHMSYMSRCQLYKYLAENQIKTPVIASHVGVAGISFRGIRYFWAIESEYKNCYKIQVPRPLGLMGTKFSPMTLSLFDEEIKFIVNSGGLIGFSLDERILGCVKNIRTADRNFEIEYVNIAEYEYLLSDNYKTDFSFLTTGVERSEYRMSQSASFPKTEVLAERQTQYFCNNLLRVVYAGGPDTWNSLCIASDFDGLVDAIKSCESAVQFENFRSKILYWLPIMIKTVDNYWSVFFVDKDNLESDLEQKVNQIFFENGRQFFANYFASLQ
jgi:hypothetical protein